MTKPKKPIEDMTPDEFEGYMKREGIRGLAASFLAQKRRARIKAKAATVAENMRMPK